MAAALDKIKSGGMEMNDYLYVYNSLYEVNREIYQELETINSFYKDALTRRAAKLNDINKEMADVGALEAYRIANTISEIVSRIDKKNTRQLRYHVYEKRRTARISGVDFNEMPYEYSVSTPRRRKSKT